VATAAAEAPCSCGGVGRQNRSVNAKRVRSPSVAGVCLRPTAVSDLHEIATFQTRCWREAYRGLVPATYLDRVTVEDREVRWRRRLVGGARQITLAEVDHAVVGVVSRGESAQARPAPSLELMSLYVAAQYRGRGVAAALLRMAIADLPAHLWVFEANAPAQRFYAKHRFRPDGQRKLDPDTGVWEQRLVRP
jgi:ribosomal protein S18 acetylase RimI-like enzyme